MENDIVVETMENGVMRATFTIEKGRLKSIQVEPKDEETIPQVYMGDKVIFSRWISMMFGNIISFMSNAPIEPIFIEAKDVKREEGKPTKQLCKRCDTELVQKKACCGSPALIYRCPNCGASYRVHKVTGGPARPVPPETL